MGMYVLRVKGREQSLGAGQAWGTSAQSGA